MENKLNAKIGDILLNPKYEQKKRELEKLKDLDLKNNPNNFSNRSWVLIFQTLEFIFKDTPIHIYNRNKNQAKKGKQ